MVWDQPPVFVSAPASEELVCLLEQALGQLAIRYIVGELTELF